MSKIILIDPVEDRRERIKEMLAEYDIETILASDFFQNGEFAEGTRQGPRVYFVAFKNNPHGYGQSAVQSIRRKTLFRVIIGYSTENLESMILESGANASAQLEENSVENLVRTMKTCLEQYRPV